MKRNSRRLVFDLHQMLRIIQTRSGKLLDNSINTISNSANGDKLEIKSFFTSTPKRMKFPCDECWNECFAKHHLEIHKEVGT